MRLALKHQIILAPAAVLLLMTLLLGFLQYTYWDLSVKRQEARRLTTAFIALAEADLATQRLNGVARVLLRTAILDSRDLDVIQELHQHLTSAVARIQEALDLPRSTRELFGQAVKDLDPAEGIDPERFIEALALLRPQLVSISETIQQRRKEVRDFHSQDIDTLVSRTAFVSIVVLGTAILLGIFLSLTFARRILRRIQTLSDGAARVSRGDFSPPPPPTRVDDELDDLALSINRMTDRLIRVVGTEKVLEGAEDERRRIAMDIHDQTLSDLSAILRGVQALKDRDSCGDEASQLEEDLQRAIANLREVMDNLHPQTLEILGLEAALESHLERHLAKEGLPEYHFYVSPDSDTGKLSRLARLSLYRIALEAIHNVIRHSRASRYEVALEQRGKRLVLSVEDNGTGFDPAEVAARGGRGLNNIRDRARAIGASVCWRASRFSSGTRFELVMPLPEPH